MNISVLNYTTLALCCSMTLMGQNQDFERFAPKEVPDSGSSSVIEQPADSLSTTDPQRERVLVSELVGLVFIESPEELGTNSAVDADGLTFNNVYVPAEDVLKERIAEYLGQPLSLALLDKITQAIVQHYQEQDYPVVHTLVPEGQDITDGVVQIAVVVGKLGTVEIQGAQHFDEQLLRSYVSLNPGDYLSGADLNEDLEWLGQNPFRSVNFILEKGAGLGETDLVVKTQDKFPLRVYTGYENSGNSQTGETRFLGGFNWGNVWGLDHQLGYQYTTSNDFDRLQAHSFNYTAPLPWRHKVLAFGSYVKSDPEQSGPGFDLEGQNWQFGLRYEMNLARTKRYQAKLSAGADFKQSNNNLEFGGTTLFASATDIFQFVLNYTGTLRDAWGASFLSTGLYFSPGGMTNHNEKDNFANSRPLASDEYTYLQVRFDRSTLLPGGFTFLNSAIGQVSTGNLLGSEQLGLGGYNSIRGYNEYEVVGDQGVSLRNELRSPQLDMFGLMEGLGDLQLLGFFDYGRVGNVDRLPGEAKHVELMSVGAGLRYQYTHYVTLRLDYGWQLKDSGQSNPHNSQVHIGLTASF